MSYLLSRVRLPPAERLAMLEDGLLVPRPLYCEDCGRPIEPYTLVLCADGYQRMYGEYVLSDPPDESGHEYNWPEAHVECLT